MVRSKESGYHHAAPLTPIYSTSEIPNPDAMNKLDSDEGDEAHDTKVVGSINPDADFLIEIEIKGNDVPSVSLA